MGTQVSGLKVKVLQFCKHVLQRPGVNFCGWHFACYLNGEPVCSFYLGTSVT